MAKEKSPCTGHGKEDFRENVCPKMGRRPAWAGRMWLFPIVGVMSLIWFLIRVTPKPSRAAYPCQRVAAPFATGFLIWASGLAGTAFAFHKWKTFSQQSRRVASVFCVVLAAAAALLTLANMPRMSAAEVPAHNPIGVGKGIHPGRVVWVHNPDATNWAGYSSTEHWYDNACTDPAVVEAMLSQAIRGIAGQNDDFLAWDAIFHHFNLAKNRGDVGYQPGEKIMIKPNFVACNVRTGYVNLTTFEKTTSAANLTDTSPQLLRAILKQLVYTVGVSQSDITVGDSTAVWPNCFLDQLRNEFPNVHYLQYGPGPGRTAAQFSTVPFYWSTTAANGKLQDFLPTANVEATYFINAANLKGHSSGITVCGKNNFGSFIRCPDGYMVDGGIKNYYDWHLSLPNRIWSPGFGHYRAMVDMMGHPQLGGKTLLYLVDGMYGGYYADSHPYKWNSAPFNGDWPSSIFVSQDPVAIDSVCHDFLNVEWPNIVSGGTESPGSLQGGAEDYLHEAALADNPLSGTFYDPDRDGVRMASLGIHEHWNNATQKQYSRNLGLDTGIELLKFKAPSAPIISAIARAKLEPDNQNIVVAGAVVTAVFSQYFYIEGDDRASGVCVLSASSVAQVGKRLDIQGSMQTLSYGERYIFPTSITAAGSGVITPLAMNGKAVGGGNWNYDATTHAGQKGIPGSAGINNIGLLIRTAGRFQYVNSTTFTVEDGSGRSIRCYVPTGVTINQSWTSVSVTGISSCRLISGQLCSVILVRTQGDIVNH